jgi:uncharacterized protein
MRGENVTFDSGRYTGGRITGCTIAGTFTDASTQAGGPVAAALLITGSGKTDRDSTALLPLGMKLRIDSTRAIAEALAGAGVSALRYDKRGVGASGGDYYTVGMEPRPASC